MTYDKMCELIEATGLLDKRHPVAFVISRRTEEKIRSIAFEEASLAFEAGRIARNGPGFLAGTPVYVFRDVPDRRCLVFCDRGVLATYLKLRTRLGHAGALLRLTAEIDAGLIREGTIRALLETS